jgi:hypothetical protein
VLADRVQQEQAVVLDDFAGLLEVGPEIAMADMLEHAHRDDVVGLAVELAVVLDLELDRQVLVPLAAIGGLVRRHRDANAVGLIFFRGKAHEGAPAAADVPHLLSRLQADLAADEVELGLLRFIDIGHALGPVTAGPGHALVERGTIGVGLAVVHLGDALAARDGLHVEEFRLHDLPDEVGRQPQRLVHAAADDAVEELGKVLAVPQAVHVGLAQTQRPLREQARPQPVIVDPDIPRIRAVDRHARSAEHCDDPIFLAQLISPRDGFVPEPNRMWLSCQGR